VSERESVESWVIVTCQTCSKPFGQEEAWMDQCPICFKQSKGYKLLKGDLAFACLQDEVERLRAARANPASPEDDGESESLNEEVQALRERIETLEGSVAKWRLKARTLKGEVERWRAEAQRVSPQPVSNAPAFDLPLLRKLILLCHPDKHQNNATATEVTAWLLNQKSKVKA